MRFDVVVPTTGRSSLAALLESLAAARGPRPGQVVLVDDRRRRDRPLVGTAPSGLRLRVCPGTGGGPAAARNVGWRRSRADWIAFLDDDVQPEPDWLEALAADLADLGDDIAGSQGRIVVPVATGRRPTDWERTIRGLETALWATADMAYRRRVLAELGGFEEGFPRAYREDADLALRAMDAGHRLVTGGRRSVHPVPPADPWVSLRRQAGNADDALMLLRHGLGWRRRVGGGRGRRPRNMAIAAAAALGAGAALAGRHRLALASGAAWLAGTAELTAARIRPGPATPRELATMLSTSVAIPPLATLHWLRGLATHAGRRLPAAVLFDRDGTLIEDVPYNGRPDLVRPRPGARAALDRLRRSRVPIAVVSNQSGVARGLLTPEQVRVVNRRVEELLGPIPVWAVCLHGPGDGCGCRKPRPGLIVEAAARLGVPPARCVVVGDIGADVDAALAVGARAILVPTPVTRTEEVTFAPEVAPDLEAAVGRLLSVGP